MSTAFVFPGQGSLRPGAVSAWDGHPAQRILDQISDGVGRDVRALADDPTTGSRTADAQPAILAASLIAWQALVDVGIRPDLVAGHSLGEYTAAMAAGSLDVRDGAALVATRGRAMGAACTAHPGSLAAVVKLTPEQVDDLVADIDDVVVANDNAPGQVVVAGPHSALEALQARVREAGGRALPLDVEGAFHSPAMAGAVPDVAAHVAALDFADPTTPLVTGTSGDTLRTGPAVADALVDGILAPVRWRLVQQRLADAGVTTIVEVGPGGVLKGLAKRTVPDVAVLSVGTPEELDQAVAAHRQLVTV